jgi:putative endonuclease
LFGAGTVPHAKYMPRQLLGSHAETVALEYLRDQGLVLLARNFRCKGGEIDLVMWERRTLVLIEVRFRSSDEYGGAAASVTPQKQRRIIRAARCLLAQQSALRRHPARFDVVAVAPGAGASGIQWIRAAFDVAQRR